MAKRLRYPAGVPGVFLPDFESSADHKPLPLIESAEPPLGWEVAWVIGLFKVVGGVVQTLRKRIVGGEVYVLREPAAQAKEGSVKNRASPVFQLKDVANARCRRFPRKPRAR
jgi:hypothetical protein